MAAIGILGGMGPQASAHLIHLLVQDAPKHITINSDTDFPEIVLLSVPVPNFIESKKNLIPAKNILLDRTIRLEKMGCTVIGIACNTAHLFLADLQSVTKVPILSIPVLVSQKIQQLGYARIGLLASPNTLSSTLFDDALPGGVELVRPNAEMARRIEEFIFDELRGVNSSANRAALKQLIHDFRSDNDLEGVILGCTELPLILGPSDDPSVINTLGTLSEGLLGHFLADSKHFITRLQNDLLK